MTRLQAIVAELKSQITISEDARVQKIRDITIITKHLTAPPTVEEIERVARKFMELGLHSNPEMYAYQALLTAFPEGEKV